VPPGESPQAIPEEGSPVEPEGAEGTATGEPAEESDSGGGGSVLGSIIAGLIVGGILFAIGYGPYKRWQATHRGGPGGSGAAPPGAGQPTPPPGTIPSAAPGAVPTPPRYYGEATPPPMPLPPAPAPAPAPPEPTPVPINAAPPSGPPGGGPPGGRARRRLPRLF
jgi:hypothetical protein